MAPGLRLPDRLSTQPHDIHPVWLSISPSTVMTRRQNTLFSRRWVLATMATGVIGGCLGQPSFPDAEVIVGPDSQNVFAPEELTVSTGETVTWGFVFGGHNVCCKPEDSDEVKLPQDAMPFASYGSDEPPERTLVPRGQTYEHTFNVPGAYEYVCIPHVERGMAGAIYVEE